MNAQVSLLHDMPSGFDGIFFCFSVSVDHISSTTTLKLTDDISLPGTKLLVFRRNNRSLLNFWFNSKLHMVTVLAAFVYAGYALFTGYRENNFSPFQIGVLVLVLPVAFWILHGLLAMNLTIRKRGLDFEKNKQVIDRLLREEYRDFHFHLRENDLLSIRLWTAEKPGKEIRVYFEDNDVMVNVKTFLRYGAMESPYHVIRNRRESREILKRFGERTYPRQA